MSGHLVCKCGCDRFHEYHKTTVKGTTVTVAKVYLCEECRREFRPRQASA